jgi:hypothetical protein
MVRISIQAKAIEFDAEFATCGDRSIEDQTVDPTFRKYRIASPSRVN